MAIKPAINPGVAVAERPATLSGAMNFISGGQTLGTSIVASAANKIVGFQRGAAAVAPKSPDLGSIISTLSTNILSNVENKLQNINQTIQQVIQNRFLSQLGEYRDKVKDLTSNPPNKILQNFLSLYKDAIGYIQFLGDRKNIKRLGENLQALQNVFSETFKIAALVRTTIVKIVKQLSNLPTASGGAGGLNLDINVPGGPLRRAAPSRGNLLKMIGMGTAVAGTGALGGKVVSGMMDIGGGVQPDTSGIAGSIPTPLLDRFMEILNRFDKALQSFQAPQKTSGGGSAGAPTKSTTGDGGGGPTSPVAPSDNLALTGGNAPAEVKALMSTIAGPESGGNYEAMNPGTTLPGATKMTIAEVARRATGAVGKYQNMPQYLVARAKAAGLDPNKDLYNPENQEKITRVDLVSQLGGDESKVVKMLQQNPSAVAQRLSGHWTSLPGGGESQLTTQSFLKKYTTYLETYKKMPAGTTPTTLPLKPTDQKKTDQIKPSVEPAPTQKVTKQEYAQQLSRPVISSDQQSNVSIVPLVMGSPQANATPTGSQVAAPPIMSKGGATVPFLSSSNEDNFFTLLSKVVYNIVDG